MRFAAVLIAAVFLLGTASAHPLGQGGGSSGSDEESGLTTILMVTAVVGFAALLVGDIISDDAVDSQDALAGISSDSTVIDEETGIDWANLNEGSEDTGLRRLAVSVFTVNNGRNLAEYISDLLAPSDGLDYRLEGLPVALGSIPPAQAAETGFAFMKVDLFLTGNGSGIRLFERGSSEPVWHFTSDGLDSTDVLRGSASLLEFLAGN